MSMIGRGFECLGWVWFASCGEDLGYSYVLHMAYTLCYIGLRLDVVCKLLRVLELGVGGWDVSRAWSARSPLGRYAAEIPYCMQSSSHYVC